MTSESAATPLPPRKRGRPRKGETRIAIPPRPAKTQWVPKPEPLPPEDEAAAIAAAPTAPSGNVYTFDESLPAVEAIAAAAAARWKHLRDDLHQAAKLAAWEATQSGPQPMEVIARAAKRAVRDCAAELLPREVDWDAVKNANPPPDPELPRATRRSLENLDDLDADSLGVLRLIFRDGWSIADAARGHVPRLPKKWVRLLVHRFGPVLDPLGYQGILDHEKAVQREVALRLDPPPPKPLPWSQRRRIAAAKTASH